MLPLYVHIKTARDALSAERVYDVHCTTYGSRPSALVTWWLGTTQLLDHSSQVYARHTETKPLKWYHNMLAVKMLNPRKALPDFMLLWSINGFHKEEGEERDRNKPWGGDRIRYYHYIFPARLYKLAKKERGNSLNNEEPTLCSI